MMPLILASQSPRRAQILRDLGVTFTVMKTESDEVSYQHEPERTVTENARLKLSACFDRVCETVPMPSLLAADTIVWSDGRIFGKPRDLDEAKAFLRALSGRTHTVFTGVSFFRPVDRVVAGRPMTSAGAVLTDVRRSDVTFRTLTDAVIDAYVARVRPTDRAGAYDIDEEGDLLISGYTGSYENVMGLPLEPIRFFLGL